MSDSPLYPVDDFYLFQTHSPAVIRRWARGLHSFRFCRAHPSHLFIHGDRFLAALRFSGEAELLDLAAALGFELNRLPPDYRPPTIWSTDDQTPPRPLPDFPHLAAPTWQMIAGIRLFLSLSGGLTTPGRLELTVTDPDDPFSVSERAFEAALQIEPLLAPHHPRLIDPPLTIDPIYCICPAYYPHIWEA